MTGWMLATLQAGWRPARSNEFGGLSFLNSIIKGGEQRDVECSWWDRVYCPLLSHA